MEKVRLDALLHELGLAPSREKAKAMILAGAVTVDGRMTDKPGTNVSRNADIEIKKDRPSLCEPGWIETGKSHSGFQPEF